MDSRLLMLLCLLVLAAGEKSMLRASSRARMRQVPLEIALRVPLLVPLGFEEANQMLADGPLPVADLQPDDQSDIEEAKQMPGDGPSPGLALQPNGIAIPMEADGPQPMFTGMLAPPNDDSLPPALHAEFEAEAPLRDTTQDAHQHTLHAALDPMVPPPALDPMVPPPGGAEAHLTSVNEDEMLKDLFDFSSILGAGPASVGKTGSPRMPLAADGVRVKTRPGHGIPSPLHLERRANQVRIVGTLPEHLNSSSLKVNQLGHVVAVQYFVSSTIGVEQNFQLDFEPESIGEATYQGSSGNFELVMNRPDDAAAPKDVHILFEEAPEEKPIANKIELSHQTEATQQQKKTVTMPLTPVSIEPSHRVDDEQKQKMVALPFPSVEVEPSHLTEDAEKQEEAIAMPFTPIDIEPSHHVDIEPTHLVEDGQKQQKKRVTLPLHRLSHDAIEPMHQLHHQAHAALETKVQSKSNTEVTNMQAGLAEAKDELRTAFEPLAEPLVVIEVDN